MTAPDRITLYPYDKYDDLDDYNPKECWDSDQDEMPDSSGTKYIRADLHAALQAENERLRNANAMWVINFENVFAEGAKAQGESDRFRAALESIRDTMDITGAESIARAALK